MCGIFGLVAFENCSLSEAKTHRAVRLLLKLSESRGKESSGIAVHKPAEGSFSLCKAAVPAARLQHQSGFKRLLRDSLSGDLDTTPYALLGHARLVTNGLESDNRNNQPICKSGIALVHNGIVVNVDEVWEANPDLKREHQVDTELIAALLRREFNQSRSFIESIRNTFSEIEGAASIGAAIAGTSQTCLATNNGSLYYHHSEQERFVVFASERLTLLKFLEAMSSSKETVDHTEIRHISAGQGVLIDVRDETLQKFSIADGKRGKSTNDNAENGATYESGALNDYSEYKVAPSPTVSGMRKDNEALLKYPREEIARLRRCSRCILPETFPFIEFDEEGVCNFCRNYQPLKHRSFEELEAVLAEYRSKDGSPDCLVTFSGGRDSSYGLHLLKTRYKMNPIAYTYDWGMVTDLARRNQSLLTAKLGVEHIIVSADIKRKRSNIHKNVSAWLKRPSLGTIPLFMAGDKQYFYYANQLRKANNLKLVILCENLLETTNFKAGFCGIAPTFGGEHTYSLSLSKKLRMLSFYGLEFLQNPAYLNTSMLDTLGAFCSYYVIEHNYLNLFDYERWEESAVEGSLFDTYNWETAEDTPSTWRIGDGTAAFYNYIYMLVAGFTEFDTFRSNQIREGMIDRDYALAAVAKENAPRYESLSWYLQTINLPFDSTVRTINNIPRLY